VFAVALILLGVIGGGVAVIHWYAYSTYYLASDGTNIVVYRGQPSGVLWYQPMVVADTGLPVTRLLPADQRALAATINEPTLSVALSHAKSLNKAWHLSRTPATTTTTSTTFPSSVTTTTRRVTPTTTTTVKKG
jgi:hypothetical protein